jgi:hypothetical protein
MVTARIRTPGVIGRVEVQQNQRTIIADPKFKVKPNVGLAELYDTDVSNPEQGDVLVYDALDSKFKASPLGEAQITLVSINGGSF